MLLLAVISRTCAASAEDIFVVVVRRIDKLTIMSENENRAIILCAIGKENIKTLPIDASSSYQ
jgi:hypothetical protein